MEGKTNNMEEFKPLDNREVIKSILKETTCKTLKKAEGIIL